jgi:hypothetical protein
MLYQLAANLVVLVHLAFILFVVLGGVLVVRWRRMAWLHIPAAIWGALIEFAGWICPLTPLERRLREAGGNAGYEGGFVEHYIVPIVYPIDLTREMQLLLGALVIAVNVVAYALVLARWRRRKRRQNA